MVTVLINLDSNTGFLSIFFVNYMIIFKTTICIWLLLSLQKSKPFVKNETHSWHEALKAIASKVYYHKAFIRWSEKSRELFRFKFSKFWSIHQVPIIIALKSFQSKSSKWWTFLFLLMDFFAYKNYWGKAEYP